METFTFNLQPLTNFLNDENTQTITCKNILNIIFRCYNIENKDKINTKNLISTMCKDSLDFKKIKSKKYISYFIDITISIIMINKNPHSEIKKKLIIHINETMNKLFE